MSLLSKTMIFSVENPCVGGSIPPRATKIHYSPLVGLFFFMGNGVLSEIR
jgi:hypothetical protein